MIIKIIAFIIKKMEGVKMKKRLIAMAVAVSTLVSGIGALSVSAATGVVTKTITEDFSSDFDFEGFLSSKGSAPFWIDNNDFDAVDVTKVEVSDGDYAVKLARKLGTGHTEGSNEHNLVFKIDLNNKNAYPEFHEASGKTIIEFDYTSNQTSNVNVKADNSIMNKNFFNFSTDGTCVANTSSNWSDKKWKQISGYTISNKCRVKIVVDYDAKKYSVSLNNGQKTEVSFADFGYSSEQGGYQGYNPETDGAITVFQINAWAVDTLWFQLDNIKITKQEKNTVVEDFSSQSVSSPFATDANDMNAVKIEYPQVDGDDYALKIARIEGTGYTANSVYHNLVFDVDLSNANDYPAFQKTSGKNIIEFDYVSNQTANVDVKADNTGIEKNFFTLSTDVNNTCVANTSNNEKLQSVEGYSANKKCKVQLIIDYNAKMYSVSMNGGKATQISFADFGYDPATAGAITKLRLASWTKDKLWFQLDNISIIHIDENMSVELKEDKYNVLAVLYGAESTTKNVCMIAAFYKDGSLVDFACDANVSVEKGINKINKEIDKTDKAEHDKVRIFLWDTLDSLSPILDVAEYSGTE